MPSLCCLTLERENKPKVGVRGFVSKDMRGMKRTTFFPAINRFLEERNKTPDHEGVKRQPAGRKRDDSNFPPIKCRFEKSAS